MTSKWKSVKANSNLIQAQTSTSVLIKLPKSELTFWHPAKCVKQSGKGGYLMEISYTDEFKFKAFRNGKGISTFNVKIEEKELNSEEFEAYFGLKNNMEETLEVVENLNTPTIAQEKIKEPAEESKKQERFSRKKIDAIMTENFEKVLERNIPYFDETFKRISERQAFEEAIYNVSTCTTIQIGSELIEYIPREFRLEYMECKDVSSAQGRWYKNNFQEKVIQFLKKRYASY